MKTLDYGEVIEKIISFIREKVNEANVNGVVGISGCVDSATAVKKTEHKRKLSTGPEI